MLCNITVMFLSICRLETSASIDVNLKSNEKSTRNFHVKLTIPIITTGAPTTRVLAKRTRKYKLGSR